MIALIRKDLRISLDLVRPLAIIVAAAFTIAPLVVPWIGQRMLGREWSRQEIFVDLAWAGVLALPLVAAIGAFLMVTGDDRHGARIMVRLLPAPWPAVVASRLVVGCIVSIGVGMLVPALAWLLSGIVTELLRGSETILVPDWSNRRLMLGWSAAIGLFAFAAVWGGASLHSRPWIGLIIGLGAAKVVVFAAWWSTIEVLETRYEIDPSAIGASLEWLLPAVSIALFTTGTIALLGARPRATILVGVALAAAIMVGTPLRAHVRFVEPAMAKGWIRYPASEIDSRGPWSFAAHLRSPEPGYHPSAASSAYLQSVGRLTAPQFAALVDDLLFIIEGHPEKASPRAAGLDAMDAIAAIDPLCTQVAGGVFPRLEARLDQELAANERVALTQLLARRAFLRPSAAAAIERSIDRFPDPELRQWARGQAGIIRDAIAAFDESVRNSHGVSVSSPGPLPAPR